VTKGRWRISLKEWRRAMEEAGLGERDYLRERKPGEKLPWDVVDPGVSKVYLLRETEKAQQGVQSQPCPAKDCVRCGVCL